MSESPTCPVCSEPLGETLRLVRTVTDQRGVVHSCGAVLTDDFLATQYGIVLPESDPMTVRYDA